MSESNVVVKSVVEVYFPSRHMTLSYLNESFDLHEGDMVFVDGKLEGLRGEVVHVGQNFKVKLSDYKHVIAKADTNVSGEMFMEDKNLVAFDRAVIPYEKVLTWFKRPTAEDDAYILGNDESSFELADFKGLDLSRETLERGEDAYTMNKVKYLSVDDGHGRAIVEGGQTYELEFEYKDGKVSKLVCDCYCSSVCKHEIAAMLQLKATLDSIKESYSEQYARTGYFAVVSKESFLSFAFLGKKKGRIYWN